MRCHAVVRSAPGKAAYYPCLVAATPGTAVVGGPRARRPYYWIGWRPPLAPVKLQKVISRETRVVDERPHDAPS